MRLHLIRHTAPIVAPGICYGRSELAVSDADCVALASGLAGQWAAQLPLYSSPLQRCRQLAAVLHPAPIFDARLMEIDFGSWEMRAWDAIARTEIDAWAADFLAYAPGGQENLRQMQARVRQFIRQLEHEGVAEAVLVCHAGVIKILAACQVPCTDAEFEQRLFNLQQKFAFGSHTVFDILL